MGWSGGDEVTEPVIKELDDLVHRGLIAEEDAAGVLEVLIRACQGRDWDTEEETLGLYQDRSWVVEAFHRCEVYLPCAETGHLWDGHEDQAYVAVTCSLPRNHTVDHYDEGENLEWAA